MIISKVIKSYTIRFSVICLAGVIPILGYSSNVFAAAIAGVAIGEKTKDPKGNVGIKVIDKDGQLVKRVISKKDGTFQILSIPDGTYTLKAEASEAQKVVHVAKAPPVTSVDFQIPERGYFIWDGVSWSLVLSVIGAAGGITAAGFAIKAANDAEDTEDAVKKISPSN